MARYIDADNIKLQGISVFDQNLEILVPLSDVREALQMTPAADVVEVVRCKDCKWFNEIGCAISIVDESDKPTENDYCSFAERRSKYGYKEH